MRYIHSATVLTSEDQRRILSMVNELKSAIESIFEMRGAMQDTYLPPLAHERTFAEECSKAKYPKEGVPDNT